MKKEITQAIEAILFASGDPVDPMLIGQALDLSEEEVQEHLTLIQNEFSKEQHGICLRQIGEKFCFATKVEMKDALGAFFTETPKVLNISQAAYETLAVVAYNEPVTRAQIESVRGVNSDAALNRLMEKGLVDAVGNLDLPGRPTLFATTELFLRLYGIRSLDELEAMDMLMYDTVQDFEKSYKKTEELARKEADNDEEFARSAEEAKDTKESEEESIDLGTLD